MIHEIELFFRGIGTGMLLAAFFDFFRAFRKRKQHSNWAVSLEDFIFWLVAATVIFRLIKEFNHGVLRFYVFLGCGLGFGFYFLTITKLLFPAFCAFFFMFKWVLSKCCLIFEIIRKIFKNLIILPLKKVWEGIKIVRNNI